MYVVLLAACAASSDAQACLFSSLARTFFFEDIDLANGVDAPAIARVTITAMTDSHSSENRSWTATAHVDRVLKGQIPSRDIKIKVMWVPSLCDFSFRVGAKGIVVGTIKRDPQGVLELLATFESLEDRERRRGSSARN
jgi:hypothetical protein